MPTTTARIDVDVADQSLWRRLRDGDRSARAELVERHIGLATRLARRTKLKVPAHVDFEDLFSDACVGLMGAIDRFDVDAGYSFGAFATPRISGAINDGLRTRDTMPRGAHARLRALEIREEALSQKLGRSPTRAEIAALPGLSTSELEALDQLRIRRAGVSLDAPVSEDNADWGGLIGDDAFTPDERAERQSATEVLLSAVMDLPERERMVILWRFFDEQTQASIAPRLGVTESRICQLQAAALKRLRESVRREELNP